jgi:hypothetical protein
VTEADEVDYEFRTSWTVACDVESERELKAQIRKRATEVTAGLDCIQSGACQLNEPTLDGCAPTRSRRSVDNNATTVDEVEVAVSVTYFVRSSVDAVTSSPVQTRAERIDGLSQIESLGKDLLQQSRSRSLYIELGGQKIFASRPEASNGPVCPPGRTAAAEGQLCGEFCYEGLPLCMIH